MRGKLVQGLRDGYEKKAEEGNDSLWPYGIGAAGGVAGTLLMQKLWKALTGKKEQKEEGSPQDLNQIQQMQQMQQLQQLPPELLMQYYNQYR